MVSADLKAPVVSLLHGPSCVYDSQYFLPTTRVWPLRKRYGEKSRSWTERIGLCAGGWEKEEEFRCKESESPGLEPNTPVCVAWLDFSFGL